MKLRSYFSLCFSIALITLFTPALSGQDLLSASELLGLKSIGGVQISPAGDEIIYSLFTPREPNDEPGGSNSTYYRMSVLDKIPVPLFNKEVKGSSPQYSPDGSQLGFLYGKKGEPKQVWTMPSSGGKMVQLTNTESGVSYFRWQPEAKGIAYLSRTPASSREKELKNRGYDFIYYEENLKNNNLFIAWYDPDWKQTGVWQLTDGVNTWDFEFNQMGTQIAAGISPKNLIDQRYMFRKIYLIDLESGTKEQISENEGKLGNYAFSPDGKHLAYTAALDINDHSNSQAFVIDLSAGSVSNLTPEGLKGHISWVNWRDNDQILYYSGEGVYPKLSTAPITGGERSILLDASKNGIIFTAPKYSNDFNNFVFTGTTPTDRSNLYYWDGKHDLTKLSNINSFLNNKTMGRQELISYQARDGMKIEGLLIHPAGYEKGESYPLIVYVHGGPESHHSNGWLSRYSTPGQVMAGRGYLVLYLNYRASTGYGVDFGMEGFMDPAGKEFDDIADGIEWAVKEKGADPERVGMAGGSYGGYASGWFATYYTRYVKAVCMFVGISNLISKRGTTDIAYEELYVHSGKLLEEQWQMNLERSPIFWAHQSQTATLIYGGAADTRVHPSQSIELYRRMKMNDHPAVRLVQYPGEGHGNRKQVGQIDVLYRQMAWFDWYVRDLKPLDGPMPPLDISDQYGLDWNF
ncbi:MAG: prolyl oligopeptidase family serine peptidase [Bacteroidota bacterium]